MIRIESQHVLSFPPEVVWPVLSKTDWLNRSIGLPAVRYTFSSDAAGGSTVRAKARLLGARLEWLELPFEWKEPEFYQAHRLFDCGPFTEMILRMDLRPETGGRSRVIFSSEAEPRNALSRWVAQHLVGPRTEGQMRRLIEQTEEFLRERAAVPFPKMPARAVNEAAFDAAIIKLRNAGRPPELVERLTAFLREAPDAELSHIRPLAVARRWQCDAWEALTLFLHATRAGLLDLSWEVLCPNCRSSSQPAASLGGLRRSAHCEVCQIQFDAEFDRSVELKFAVNAAIRPRDSQIFCIAGPGGQPHVAGQFVVASGGQRTWQLPGRGGPFRVRSPQVRKVLTIDGAGGAAPAEAFEILCEPAEFRRLPSVEDLKPGEMRARNPNPFSVVLSIEQIGWSDDILTAARVTNWQEFRDLFSSEVVSPSEQVTVGSQVVLFTDLRGSTAMYHGLGDAPAYALVRDHFRVLGEAIRAHHGSVVKTIGDAVMACFSRVDEALAAVRDMHLNLAAIGGEAPRALALKSSLHVGPCLAVNANDRLDFFGTTINLAARMVDCCRGGDLTVSDELFQRPETAAFLATASQSPEPSEVHFRGFDAPHRVWRIEMK